MPNSIGNKILDLLGREFKVGDWSFHINPLGGIPDHYLPCLTRDRLSDLPLTLFFDPSSSHYIMQTYNSDLRLYVRYQLTFIKYNPKKDMRNIKV